MGESASRPLQSVPRWAWIVIGILAVYFLVAYVLVPQFYGIRTHRHPDLRDAARLTHTGSGLPGDPLNISLVGSDEDVIGAFLAAGWRRAAALGLRSDVRIAVDTVFDKPDPNAPVSNLY